MKQLVGGMKQFVGEMKQFVGEMKQIWWGNEAKWWAIEAKSDGEMPHRQSEITPSFYICFPENSRFHAANFPILASNRKTVDGETGDTILSPTSDYI